MTKIVEHKIELSNHKQIKLAPYKTAKSNSPYSSPVVLARKKNAEYRFCVDFRAINKITRKDAYPLPRVEESQQILRNNHFYITLDLLSGFWQIPLAEKDRHKPAFATRNGLYQFRVMPFGLTNAPVTFQRLMDKVFSGLNWKSCIVYIDDIIVFDRTLE